MKHYNVAVMTIKQTLQWHCFVTVKQAFSSCTDRMKHSNSNVGLMTQYLTGYGTSLLPDASIKRSLYFHQDH